MLGNRKRRGFTLVEMIGVLVVMGILMVVGIGVGIVGVNNSKYASTEKALDEYRTAFISVCTQYPGVINDRRAAWGTDGSTYTSAEGLKRLVNYMNSVLDDNRAFKWDDAMKCYVSYGDDPFGGNFILTEYPITITSNYYDLNHRDDKSMEIAIWATGNSEYLSKEQSVSDKDIGILLRYANGDVDIKYTGTENFDNDEDVVGANVTFA